MKLSSEEIKSGINLQESLRYQHFLKKVADWEQVWELFENGWAMAETSSKELVFPLWPAQEYATLCVADYWGKYIPKSFSGDDLLRERLPNLHKDGITAGVFYTPKDEGVVVDAMKLANDLKVELEKY